jgi:hypothetical protein
MDAVVVMYSPLSETKITRRFNGQQRRRQPRRAARACAG